MKEPRMDSISGASPRALARMAGAAVESASLLNQFATLAFLNGAHYLSALTSQQLQALASLPLALPAYDISTVFFGFNALALGYLVFRSTFLPRVIGGLLVID